VDAAKNKIKIDLTDEALRPENFVASFVLNN
jgi:hypothetical protein